MTITYPLSLPSAPGIKKVKPTMDSAVAFSESPFTFEQQTYAHQGQRWRFNVTLPMMRRDFAEQWIATMAKLNGRQGTFLLGDPDAKVPRGVATGTPLVNGASQVGNSLITDGWTHSITGIMKAGDYIQLGSGSTARMYKILDDVNSDGSGNATFSIWPNLRSSPADDDTVVVQNCKTQCRLDQSFNWDANEVSTYEITFGCSEAL